MYLVINLLKRIGKDDQTSIKDVDRGETQKKIAVWLFLCCGLILTTVMLGGLTRLTQSGLSMVDWQPLSVLPPMDNEGWERVFTDYQRFPEFKLKNSSMVLKDFKKIFWLEYVHRLMGRIIGVSFLMPFLWLLSRGKIGSNLSLRLTGVLLLGTIEGIMGWVMVQSGLANQPDVSQYRLVIHLGLALLIYALLLWIALGLIQPRKSSKPLTISKTFLKTLTGALGLVTSTLLSGGFVAGLDAGLIYNSFPMMNGEVIPQTLMSVDPWYLNFFENTVTVQFQHRLLAMISLAVILLLWGWSWILSLPASARIAIALFAIIAVTQVTLGIMTLLLAVPTALAAVHQLCAFALFTSGLVTVHLLFKQ